MPVTAHSTPNIALIKYWGNRHDDLRLPSADSLSMTLNTPCVDVTVDHADTLKMQSFEADGKEKNMSMKHVLRIQKHLDVTKQYCETLGVPDALPASVTMTIHSAIPQSVGIASSAAVFSAIAEAYAGLIRPYRELSRKEVSVIARLGSGSAARGVFGGYSALIANEGDDIGSAYAVQIAPTDHWLLYDVIVVPSQEEKKYGSTEGHAFAHTSPRFNKRIADIPRRQRECIDAIKHRDFEKLQAVAEEDCMDMHEVMKTSDPQLHYLSEETYKIIDAVEVFRHGKHIPVLYTMDAGPTVHLFCTEEARDEVTHFAHEQGHTVFIAHTGEGSHLLGKAS